MSSNGAPAGWYPIMQSRQLGPRPVRRYLAGQPILVSRTNQRTAEGRNESSGALHPLMEHAGWVFAAIGDPGTEMPGLRDAFPAGSKTLLLDGYVRAGLGDVAENILDTTHTSVVHQDYLRKPGDRCRVEAIVTSGDGWISATYPAGAAPGGWGARLLGAQNYAITDTFRAPATADVTYALEGRTAFAARFRLSPVNADTTYVAATIRVPDGLLSRVKLAILHLFFRRIFAEDRAILELIGTNLAAHGHAPLVFAPQDLLRPGIEAILSGRTPGAAAARVSLKV